MQSDMMESSLPDELYFASKQRNLLPLFFLGLHFDNKKEVVGLGDKVDFFGVYKPSSQAPSLSMD
jgi:hypothetical protein